MKRVTPRAAGLLVLLGACEPLELDTAIPVSLSAAAERVVNNENPRVFACNVTLAVRAGSGERDVFLELLTMRRTVEIEGQESTASSPASSKLGTRRLYPQTEFRGTDSFSATFPFRARFGYTLHYRDMNLRIDSTHTSVQCG